MRLSGDLYGESHGRIDLSLFGGKTEKIYVWHGCGCMDTVSEYCIRCYPSLDAHREEVDRLRISSADLKEFMGHMRSSISRVAFESIVVPWIQRREEKMRHHIQHLYTVNHGQGLEQRISFCGHPWGRTKEFYYYCRMKHIQSFFEYEKEECVYYEEAKP
jgi:hypothetical protein